MKSILTKNTHETIPEILPVVPTMDVVVFPHMIVPLLVMDERIIQGINQALDASKMVMLLAAKEPIEDNHGAVGTKDLYSVGTVASIMRIIKVPEGGVKILVQGMCKARVRELFADEKTLTVSIQAYEDVQEEDGHKIAALVKNIKELAEKMSLSGQSFSPDFHLILSKMYDPQKIADFVLSHLNISVADAQGLLERQTQVEFLEGISQFLFQEYEIAEVQEQIKNNARESMNKSQKEFYLREQLRAIKKELGEDELEDVDKMREAASKLALSEEALTEVNRQINRLERTSADSMEASVIRTYLDWMLNLPWGKETVDNLDIKHAKAILDKEHYGLKEIKERILDYISIRNLKQDGHTPILCFVGPPGTGKTSLGKSIATSLGREMFRISLGGVKDEAEIRGHRRTYVGAMPGRLIQGMRKAGTMNPIIVIDELDKLGSDFRGDPSAAMLEVLDPQQNKTFYDNYLGVAFDLSKVIFIATANSLETISEPLRDRMEVIQLSGYTLEEKKHIAHNHLVSRAVNDSGLQHKDLVLQDGVVEDLVMNYTREAGVRQLDRLLHIICSKTARSLVEKDCTIHFTPDNLEQHIGPRKFIDDDVTTCPHIGVTNGLAWTQYGGEMLRIEAILMPGRGKLMLTGQLGNVMKESAQAALSFVRAHAKDFRIGPKMFTEFDLHIHVPAGAIPKDGPSAGITMITSILSAFSSRPVDHRYAMTGEINLHGDVMAIGGVKEKILAAKRNNVMRVIMPQKNKKDIIGADEIVQDMELMWVQHASEVLECVLLDATSPKA
jgi:ATP-dependent Lon protease